MRAGYATAVDVTGHTMYQAYNLGKRSFRRLCYRCEAVTQHVVNDSGKRAVVECVPCRKEQALGQVMERANREVTGHGTLRQTAAG